MAKVYVVNQPWEADVKLFRVREEYLADLRVYITDEAWRAENDQIWFYVEQPWEASVSVFWVENEWEADIKVYFEEYEYQAGWNTSNPWQNRLW